MPTTSKIGRHVYLGLKGLLLLGALTAAALLSRGADWHPLTLVVLLGGLVMIGNRLVVTIRSQRLSGAFVALVLAMSLLGPSPAVAFLVVTIAYSSTARRLPFRSWLNNVSLSSVLPLVGALTVRALGGDVHAASDLHAVRGTAFGLIVFGAAVATNTLNFVLVALDNRLFEHRSLLEQVRRLYVPLLPAQLAAAALAAALAVAFTNLGFPVLLGSIVVLLVFQYLAVALMRSEERADQLAARTMRLASLQLGVLTTLMETLALRDRITARHVAAVAHYARALAREAGCEESEQEIAHTAGLLHDIGMFALPDRLLHAELLSDEDWATIHRHPYEGATLVGRLDGYGPVAEVILAHHEHVDGTGYPAGLIGREIPLLSRIVAICEAYDAMTARHTYRAPMTAQDAFAELRRSAGRQFDTELVERFIAMLERDHANDPMLGDSADFEAELEFERRVRAIAAPLME